MRVRASITWSVAVAAAISAAIVASLVIAQTPPLPDFYWPYGTVQVDGSNISPTVQPVVAFVNGRSCGQNAFTVLVEGNSDNPPVDAGKTVYVVNVLADGTGPGRRPGCGTAGASVMLYFPAIARIASQEPLFKAGGERVNLTLDTSLPHRLRVLLVAAGNTP